MSMVGPSVNAQGQSDRFAAAGNGGGAGVLGCLRGLPYVNVQSAEGFVPGGP